VGGKATKRTRGFGKARQRYSQPRKKGPTKEKRTELEMGKGGQKVRCERIRKKKVKNEGRRHARLIHTVSDPAKERTSQLEDKRKDIKRLESRGATQKKGGQTSKATSSQQHL